jgi:tetratricopeptide (TPR) repeat protein
MRNQNFFQVVVILSAVVGIASIDPKSQLSALIAVKKAAAQSACQNTQGDTPSDHNIEMKERPLIGIASYLAALGQYDQALKLVDRMKACDLRDIALVKVASTLAKGGEYDQALKLVDRMKEPGFRDIALVEVASTLAKERQFDRALQLVNIIRRHDEKALALNSIAKSLAQAGQIDRALQLANTIQLGYRKASLLDSIVDTLTEAGNYEQALRIADTIADTDEVKTHKQDAFVNIAYKLASSGKIDLALQVANRLDDRSKARALGAIASSLAKTGQFNQAMQLVETIKNDPLKAVALVRLAENLTEANQLEQVLQEVKKIQDGSMEEEFTISSIAISFAKVGQFDRALQLASSSKSDQVKDNALRSITRSLAQAGQYDRAKKVASTMKEGPDKAMAFVYIAASLAEVGKIADALQVVSSIEDRTPVTDTWFSETLMVLTEERKYNPALQMANTIRDENEKAWTLTELANELIKAGQTELASQAIKPALEIVGFEQMVRP